jgi:5-(carboxyamino)imidazole ribonucleotide mutase
VIIAAAGMAAHIMWSYCFNDNSSCYWSAYKLLLDGLDALLAIVDATGIPVATVGIDASQNAAILAAQILATSDEKTSIKVTEYKESLKIKL